MKLLLRLFCAFFNHRWTADADELFAAKCRVCDLRVVLKLQLVRSSEGLRIRAPNCRCDNCTEERERLAGGGPWVETNGQA